ncbi:putative DMT superfamily transporter inner membrane protein [Pseudovibrio axinellae]|uniref:Putative DMT superfamily transporter inner membrane protein n=1 Tax=Pseudovibrio axinellae TaxID=989403 RepID=A0A166AGW2_9HYPH|nr:DMT family transporter [Pseudovibrio axinellae]KZL21052.1 putative DMT superfamily transporter inner membrane protein [Pseudovibrio axinellae]SEP77363.1 probable blue pigment (indigoidine) exporter [Pseudovibrio axinellae]
MLIQFRTALTPAIWGTTYAITILLLPAQDPVWMVVYRLLPAGLLLLAFAPGLLSARWMQRAMIIGLTNLSMIFFVFIAAFRLPSGMAGTIMATLPLQVIFYIWVLDGKKPIARQLVASFIGLFGVALLLLGALEVDWLGIGAAMVACLSTFTGVYLSNKWGKPEASMVTYTGWHVTLGGLYAVPIALILEGAAPIPDLGMALAFFWIGIVGMGWASVNWLKGIVQLNPTTIGFLSLVNPVSAVVCGQVLVGEDFGWRQWVGICIVLGSIVYALKAPATATAAKQTKRATATN